MQNHGFHRQRFQNRITCFSPASPPPRGRTHVLPGSPMAVQAPRGWLRNQVLYGKFGTQMYSILVGGC